MTAHTRPVAGLLLVVGVLAVPFLVGPMTGIFGWGHIGTTAGGWGHMSGTGWGHMAGTGWGLGWLFALAIPLLLVAAIGYLLVAGRSDTGIDESEDEALAELRAAYARGEIDDEEFENRRWRLRQGDD